MIGTWSTPGRPLIACLVCGWIRPAIAIEPPEGISSVVSARRVWIEGMVIELVEDEDSAWVTVMALWLDSSDTLVITRRLIRPSLSTTGVKFREMPNFL